jgi:hypothetical protein
LVYKDDLLPLFERQLDMQNKILSLYSESDLEPILNTILSIKNAIVLDADLNKYSTIKSFAYDLLDKLKEKDVEKLYKENNISNDEKERIIIAFLKSAAGYNNYPNVDTSDEKVQSLYNKIKSNSHIVNQIISGENICAPFVNIGEVANEMEGDYVFMIICQVKTVERYLKEELVQNYTYNIRTKDKVTGKLLNAIVFRDTKELTADSLSKRDYSQNGKYYGESWELGPVSIAVQNVLMKDNPTYSGIFKPRSPKEGKYMTFDFNTEFIQKVRNSYLHNEMINTIGKALNLRKKVAYWFYRCIDELPPLYK